MEAFSRAALLVLVIIVFQNLTKGTLGSWFQAKFLGNSSTSATGATKPAIPTTLTGAHVPPTHIFPTGGGGRF